MDTAINFGNEKDGGGDCVVAAPHNNIENQLKPQSSNRGTKKSNKKCLACRDWFRKGQNLYDVDNNGVLHEKKYGMESRWEVVSTKGSLSSFAFLRRENAL
jgi:hypothetical protein